MRRLRRTKILATLGPSSSDRTVIADLFRAGADIFRINMSHTSHERMRELVGMIRAVEFEYGRPIGILVDLQGPKLRVGTFAAGPVTLAKGDTFVLDANPAAGDATRAHLPHPEIFAAVEPGHHLLLDDGKVKLVATEVDQNRIVTRVEVGGKLSDRKGVSVPDTILGFSALAAKDRSDLEAALDAGIDWVALSFIQRPEDIAEAKKITRGRAAVMAKIEKPQAVLRLDEIVDLSDALMVARGDLGVEMPLEKVPGIQKQITRTARRVGKPVVVATQMLESMITSPVPTRAEVSDVATAIFDGADAVMLSAESASGQHPVEAVAVMDRIAQTVENDPFYRPIMEAQRQEPDETMADAILAHSPRMSREALATRIAWDRILRAYGPKTSIWYTASGSNSVPAAPGRNCITAMCSALRSVAWLRTLSPRALPKWWRTSFARPPAAITRKSDILQLRDARSSEMIGGELSVGRRLPSIGAH
jgi:pyruvate kinase